MNTEIGCTIQTFEQENEDTWHLKRKRESKNNELLFGRFFANSNFVQERLLNVPTISSPSNLRNSRLTLALIYRRPYSKSQSWDYHQFYWGILRLLGTYHFISWSSFLYWWFRYPCWWSQSHDGLSFLWFIGVDIIKSTCVGINTWTGPCTGSDNYAELR